VTWAKDILLELAKKVTAKNAFILLMTFIICSTGYFIIDRFLDYEEATLVQGTPSSVEDKYYDFTYDKSNYTPANSKTVERQASKE